MLPKPWHSLQLVTPGTAAWNETELLHAVAPGLASAAWQATQSLPTTQPESWLIHCRSFDTVAPAASAYERSEEHTSELQSQSNLVCRLLLEKKKKKNNKCDCVNTNGARSCTI